MHGERPKRDILDEGHSDTPPDSKMTTDYKGKTENLNFKISTLNVRGIRNKDKRRSVFLWAKEKNIDILCLQETHITEEIVNSVNKDWNGEILHSITNSSFSRGVAILFSKKLNFEIVNTHRDSFGRKLLININLDNENITNVNAYAPNNDKARKDFLKRLNSWTKQYAIDCNNVFIMGDLNIIEIKMIEHPKI